MRQPESKPDNSNKPQGPSQDEGSSTSLPNTFDISAHRSEWMHRATHGDGPASGNPGASTITLPGFTIRGISAHFSIPELIDRGLLQPAPPFAGFDRHAALFDSIVRGFRPYGEYRDGAVRQPHTPLGGIYDGHLESGHARELLQRRALLIKEVRLSPPPSSQPIAEVPREQKRTDARGSFWDQPSSERSSGPTQAEKERSPTEAPKERRLEDPAKPERDTKRSDRVIEKAEGLANVKTNREAAELSPQSRERPERERDGVAPDTRPGAPRSSDAALPREALTPSEPLRPRDSAPTRAPIEAVSPSVLAVLNDSRNDMARLIAQVINAETPPRPHTVTSAYPSPDPAQNVPAGATAYHISVNEKLSQIRDSLQSALQQTSPRPTPEQPSASEGRSAASRAVSDFAIADPLRRATPTINELQRGERAVGNYGARAPDGLVKAALGSHTASMVIPAVAIPSREGPLVRGLRPVGASEIDAPRQAIERASSLTDAITKALAKVVSIQTLRRVDRALETSVIAVAAAIALGVIGAEMALREVSAVAKLLQRALRERSERHEEGAAEGTTNEDIITELEMALAQHGVTIGDGHASHLVADITGLVVTSDNVPVEGVAVHGGSLGITMTDSSGLFRFTNIALATAYSITLSDERYTFGTHHLEGTVSGADYIKVTATPIS